MFITPETAGVMVFDSNQMPQTWKGIFPDLYTLYFPFTIFPEHLERYVLDRMSMTTRPFEQWSKSIVRINDVYSVNAHGPEVLLDTAKLISAYLPHYLAHYKHIRYRGPSVCMFGKEALATYFLKPNAVLQYMEN